MARVYLAATTAFVLVSASSKAQEGGHEPLAQLLAAHGGLERFEAISSWRIVAERNLFTGDGPSHETYEELMKRSRSGLATLLVKRRPSETLVFGHDGTTGFAVTNGVEQNGADAEAEGYYRAHGEYYLRAIPFKWADPGVTVRTLGRGASGLELLEMRAGEGVGRDFNDVWVAAIDPSTGRLREARLTHAGSREIVYRYSDYRIVADVWFPFRLEYLSNGEKTGENVIQSIDVDAALDDAEFTPAAHRK